MKVIIERDKWCRGGLNGSSRLLNGRGNMCCLGFAAKDFGFRKEELENVPVPITLAQVCSGKTFEKGRDYFEKFLNLEEDSIKSKPVCRDLIDINDSTTISEEKREHKLKELFKTIGIEVEFV